MTTTAYKDLSQVKRFLADNGGVTNITGLVETLISKGILGYQAEDYQLPEVYDYEAIFEAILSVHPDVDIDAMCEIYTLEKLCDTYEIGSIDDYVIECLEYYAVSNALARLLKDKGETVFELDTLHVWGRTCTGQSAIVDDVFEELARDMGYLEPHKYVVKYSTYITALTEFHDEDSAIKYADSRYFTCNGEWNFIREISGLYFVTVPDGTVNGLAISDGYSDERDAIAYCRSELGHTVTNIVSQV